MPIAPMGATATLRAVYGMERGMCWLRKASIGKFEDTTHGMSGPTYHTRAITDAATAKDYSSPSTLSMTL
jgi:hypothetical protein